MLYLSMSNDMGLYFLSVFQLPAEKTTIFILKKDHSSVLSVVELHFHFIVTTVHQVNAAGIVRNRNQGVVNFLQLAGFLIHEVNGFWIHDRLIEASAERKNLAGTSAATAFFLPRHPVHFFKIYRQGIFVQLVFRCIGIHIFHCDFLLLNF